MAKNPLLRRAVVALLLLLGPLTQFQTLYACEVMEHDHKDGRPSMVCCCDKLGEMAMMACEMDGSCQDQAGGMAKGCCDISYEPSQTAEASAPGYQSQQVLLLDAPQPPPILVSFDLPDIVPLKRADGLGARSSPPLPPKPVYLLTRRFRI
ncbi:MAG TPA: hypothetical protein ENJ79_08930 [Gammaproteobacteria bacterium]|nr:hypothetical protein [Gammaproteobacteria bacterium]